MRKIITIIMVILTLACVSLAFACGEESEKTPTVEVGQVSNVDMDLGQIKWKKADNATSYKIQMSYNGELDESVNLTTNKVMQNVKKYFKKAGEYKFTITALNGDAQGTPVDFIVDCIKLDTPKLSISEDGTRYVWEEIENATKYTLFDVYTVEEEDPQANYVNDEIKEDTEKNFYYPINPGAHTLTVKAIGSFNGDTVYIESDDSEEISGIEIERYTFFTVGKNSWGQDMAYFTVDAGYGVENANKYIKFLYKTEDKWGNPIEGVGTWGRRYGAGIGEYWFVEKGETCDDREWTRGSLPINDWIDCYGRLDENGNIKINVIDFEGYEYFAIKDVEILDNLTVLDVKVKYVIDEETGEYVIDEETGEPIKASAWDSDFKDIYGATQTTTIETEFAGGSTVTVQVRFMERSAGSLLGEGPVDKEGNPTLRYYEIGGVRKNFTERADIANKEDMPYTTDWVELTCTLNEDGGLDVEWGGMHIYEYILIKDIELAD